MPDLDRLMAERYLRRLDPKSTTWTFQTFDDNKARKDSRLARVLHGTLDEHWDTLCGLNSQGAGVFVTVNETDGTGRKAGNIIRVRAIWQEDDGEGKPLPIQPHIVVESSPGKYHRYILVDGCPLDAFRGFQQRMVESYGSDPNAADISRVLRLPGFFHQKDRANPHMVRIVNTSEEGPLTYEQAKRVFPPVVRVTPPEQMELPDDVDLLEIESALEVLAPDMEYSHWLNVGMALHDATGGSSAGLEMWDSWSSKGDKYQTGKCAAKWESFTGSGITIATLIKMAKDAGWTEPVEDWEPPVFINQADLPKFTEQDFPPDLWPMIDAVSKATETPVELGATIVLAVVATAVQKKVEVEVEPGYSEPTNIYCAAIMPPGSRKSATLKEFCAPLHLWEKDQTELLQPKIEAAQRKRETEVLRLKELQKRYAKETDPEKAEALNDEIEGMTLTEVPAVPRLLAQDITPEHLGTMVAENGEKMAIISAEGGIFETIAGRYNRGTPNLDLFLQAHAGDSVRVDRGSRPPVAMEKPALTIGLMVQPDVIQGLANKPGFRGRGLTARFMFVRPKDNVGRRTLQTEPIPAVVKENYNELILTLLKMPACESTQMIELSSGALKAWKIFQRVVEDSMAAGGEFEHMRDFGGKLPGAAARIAGLFHCCENRVQPWMSPLAPETMQRAISLTGKIAEHTRHVFTEMGADDGIHVARKILNWIGRTQAECFTARGCHAALKGSFPKRSDLAPGLEVLLDRGYIRRMRPVKRASGRPSEKFEINPLLQV
jgi:hypothetical protein